MEKKEMKMLKKMNIGRYDTISIMTLEQLKLAKFDFELLYPIYDYKNKKKKIIGYKVRV